MATPPRKLGFKPNMATPSPKPMPRPNKATLPQKPVPKPNMATPLQRPVPKPKIDFKSSNNMATSPQKPVPIPNIDFTSFSNIIGGKLCKSTNTFHATNPATKRPLEDVPAANRQDVEQAVHYANVAQKEWAKKTWKERQQICLLFKDTYSKYVDDLTNLLTLEIGRPKESCRAEVRSCGFFADFHAHLPSPGGDSFDAADRDITVRYTPLGVVAAICPWNAPLVLCFGKLFPAVIAGNSIIIKPSPYTPYTTLKMVEIAQQVFPPGVVQVLAGDASLGASLVEHPDIHKISFTGSIPTGKKILQAAAPTMKRVTLEVSQLQLFF
jgi:acyl-CoA reductase-like NAD-dependent aldehyde dehydrogenase